MRQTKPTTPRSTVNRAQAKPTPQSTVNRAQAAQAKPTTPQSTVNRAQAKQTTPRSTINRVPAIKLQQQQKIEDRFFRYIKSEISQYLIDKPDVPLDILSNLYSVFDQFVLTSTRLDIFNASPLKFLVLDINLYGHDNITLLVKFNRRTYIVILEGTYSVFYDSLTDVEKDAEDVDVPGLRNFWNKITSIAAFKVHPQHLKVMLALPIVPSRDRDIGYENLSASSEQPFSFLVGIQPSPTHTTQQTVRQIVSANPNVPLDVLLHLHSLFEFRKLTSTILDMFMQSQDRSKLLETPNVMLYKFGRRVYLIVENLVAIPLTVARNRPLPQPFDSRLTSRLSQIPR